MADPDLQMGGGGGGGGLRKKLLRPFGPHFRLNIRGGPGPPGRPLDPPLLKKGAKVFLNCSLEYKGAFHFVRTGRSDYCRTSHFDNEIRI